MFAFAEQKSVVLHKPKKLSLTLLITVTPTYSTIVTQTVIKFFRDISLVKYFFFNFGHLACGTE